MHSKSLGEQSRLFTKDHMPLPKNSLLIWGAGGHAKVVADAARASGWTVFGFLDEDATRHQRSFYGSEVLGGSDFLTSPRTDRAHCVFVAIGGNSARSRCIATAVRAGYAVPVLIHPAAVVSPTAQLGHGTIVMAGAIVQAGTRIGAGGIVNTGASVDHDCILGSCVHIAPGARLTGQIEVGDETLIGVGAVVIPRIRIGNRCTVGAGAVVIADVLDDQTVVGVPARTVSRC